MSNVWEVARDGVWSADIHAQSSQFVLAVWQEDAHGVYQEAEVKLGGHDGLVRFFVEVAKVVAGNTAAVDESVVSPGPLRRAAAWAQVVAGGGAL